MSVFLPESIGVTYPEFSDGSLIDRVQWAFEGLTLFAASSVSSLVFLLLIAGSILAIFYAWYRTSSKRVRPLTLPVIFTLVLLGMYCLMFPLLQLRYFAWLVPALVISLMAALKMGLPKRMYGTLLGAAIAGGLLLFIPALNHRAQSVQVQELRGKVGRVINEITPPDARIALEPIGEIGFYADRYIVDLGGLINTDIQKYIINGYQDIDRMWECLTDYEADYLVTYDHDRFMGRLPAAYPDRFEFVTYIESDYEYVSTRYRLLRARR